MSSIIERIKNMAKEEPTFMEELDYSVEQDSISNRINNMINDIKTQIGKFRKDLKKIRERKRELQKHKDIREDRIDNYKDMQEKLENILGG